MEAYNFKSIMQLMHAAKNHGISLFVEDSGLKVRLPKGGSVDASLMAELKKHKNELLKILTGPTNNGKSVPGISCEGRTYYEITGAQQWWVDMDTFAEFKESVFGLYRAKLTGSFDCDIFAKSILYVIGRHESLRSSFRKIGDKYFMHVNDVGAAQYKIDFKEYSDLPADDRGNIERFLSFYGHKFNIADGPLFLVRLLKLNEDEFHVAIKVHHAIYDGWSIEVLWRDLFMAYAAIMQNGVPTLRPLDLQYKECMHFLNEYVKQSEELHRRYWSEACADLPEPFVFPGAKQPIDTRKIARSDWVTIKKNESILLHNLSVKYKVNISRLLQASLCSFLHSFIKHKDIFFATTTFGRDVFGGMEDQIGFYSKMVLIKVSIDSADGFADIVKKVERANDDTQKYRAYTLMQMIESQLPEGFNIFDQLWKVTIEFSEGEGYTDKKDFRGMLSKLPFEIQLYPEEEVNSMNEDLRFSFLQSGDELKLNLTYNSTVFDAPTIKEIITSYKSHLLTLR